MISFATKKMLYKLVNKFVCFKPNAYNERIETLLEMAIIEI